MIPKPAEIRATRQSLNLSQTQAAEFLGLRRLAWSKYENGTVPMPPFAWAYWCHVTGVTRIPFRKRP